MVIFRYLVKKRDTLPLYLLAQRLDHRNFLGCKKRDFVSYRLLIIREQQDPLRKKGRGKSDMLMEAFRGLPQYTQANLEFRLKIGHDQFIPHPFQFILIE